MVTSKWQTQNTHSRNVGIGVTIVVTLLITALFNMLGQAQLGAFITGAGVIIGGLVTFNMMKRNPKTMIRVLKIDYEQVEREFRILFKNNHIRFQRSMEDDFYEYQLLGHHLTMRVRPYVWHNWDMSQSGNTQPATQVTLAELDAKNRAFAEQLAKLIDEMAEPLPDSWEKD